MSFIWKNIFTAMFLLLAGVQIGWAQKMTVRMTNAQTVEFNVPEVESVTFDEGSPATGPQYVDLELPSGTLWATCNIGANTPEEYGSYFAWGETQTKNVYNWGVYKLCGGTQQTMKKYCVDSKYGTVDNLMSLEAMDDAATVNWGSEWQMPSQDQFKELQNAYYTTCELTTQNDVYGLKVTSRINGKSIFLPAAGGFCTNDYYGAEFTGAGSTGIYWTRSLYQNACYGACYLFFYSGNVNATSYTNRYYGCSIRPVRGKVQPVTSITLPQYMSLQLNETKLLTPTVLPTDATNPAVTWESSDAYVAEVTQSGRVMAKGSGSCVVTCRATDGSGVFAECQVTVGGAPVRGSVHGHEWVDLMLPSQTLWATCNVGASTPDRHGDYFAWGETTTKDDYSWGTYRYCEGSQTTMTKYCVQSNYGSNGFTDDLKLLLPEDDAASVNWCECWQMPTSDQFYELVHSDNTTYKWTTVNGVNGVIITSKRNGESIFLPASGDYNGTKNSIVGTQGHYWTRSLNTGKSYCASHYQFNPNISPQGYSDYSRFFGLPVRPVLVPGSFDAVQLVTNITLSATTLNLQPGETQTLTATVLPADATNLAVVWESSNEDVAEVTNNGRVIANAEGTCTITCSAIDGSGVSARCRVIVGDGGDTGIHEWVDLGLPSGTLWATCNIGANAPEEFGDYIAWGETTPKETYSWENYSLCNGSGTSIVKYCLRSAHGTVDNKTELEPEDDAATVNWGSEWQMPSPAQITELTNTDYTTSEMARVNGVLGKKVTSRANGNSIFLPFPGYYDESLLIAEDLGGYYWTRSLYDADETLPTAYYLCMSSDAFELCIYGGARYFGFPVRPVRKK